MPRQPQWYQRVPEAIRALNQFPAPVVDRQGLEHLLGLGRRDAIRLMHRLGGYQCGRTFLVNRDTLAEFLHAVGRGDAWHWEARRRRRVAQDLEEAHRDWEARRRVLPVTAPSTAGLPESLHLSPGTLEIRFAGTVDLLTQLLMLTRHISENYIAYEESLGA